MEFVIYWHQIIPEILRIGPLNWGTSSCNRVVELLRLESKEINDGMAVSASTAIEVLHSLRGDRFPGQNESLDKLEDFIVSNKWLLS